MAMAVDAAAQAVVQSDIDFEMEADNALNEIDFDIDIEPDEHNANVDVEVYDAPEQHQNSEAYADEIMHEEAGESDEVEMQEHQVLDEDMDETVYHEAQSQVYLDTSATDKDHQFPASADVANDNETDNFELEEAWPDIEQKLEERPLGGLQSLEQQEAADEGSAATSVTLEAGIIDNGQNSELHAITGEDANQNQDNLVLNETTDGNVDDAEKPWTRDDASHEQPAESRLDDQEVQPAFSLHNDDFGNSQVEAHDKEQQGQPDHKDEQDEPQENRQEEQPEDTLQELEEIEGPEEEHDESTDEGYNSVVYNATVNFDGQTLNLFSDQSLDGNDVFLLSEASLAEQSLAELLAACRVRLENAMKDDQILVIEIDGLKLILSENDDDCSELTLSQIIDVYHHLHSNEESYEPEPIALKLSIQSKPTRRLNQLFRAAEAGKGYSAIASNDAGSDSVEESHVEDSEDLEEQYDAFEEDLGDGEYENEQTLLVEGEEAVTLATGSSAQANVNDVSQPIETTIAAEGSPLAEVTTQESSTALTNIEQETVPFEGDLEATEEFDADDLIDYSEDEDAVQSGQQSTPLTGADEASVQHAKAHTVNEPAVIIDQAEIEDHGNTHYDDASIQARQGEDEGSIDQKSAIQNDQLDISNHEPITYEIEDDGIDFGFSNASDGQEPLTEALGCGSPSAKRTWDEHAADLDSAVQEQDFKRMRSDG